MPSPRRTENVMDHLTDPPLVNFKSFKVSRPACGQGLLDVFKSFASVEVECPIWR